jgi:hypothetical protein
MPPLPPAAPIRAIVDRLPPALRAFLDTELAGGSEILWARGGHPAPPIGECIMLSRQVDGAVALADGLRRRDRNSSLYASEFTDADERYFILTPALEPPPYPDMDAIRAAHDAPPFVAPPRPRLPTEEWLELDIRGETLIYHLDGARCSVQWFHSAGHEIHRSTLSEWFESATRRTTPMDAEEAALVFARIVALAAPRLGTSDITIRP